MALLRRMLHYDKNESIGHQGLIKMLNSYFITNKTYEHGSN